MRSAVNTARHFVSEQRDGGTSTSGRPVRLIIDATRQSRRADCDGAGSAGFPASASTGIAKQCKAVHSSAGQTRARRAFRGRGPRCCPSLHRPRDTALAATRHSNTRSACRPSARGKRGAPLRSPQIGGTFVHLAPATHIIHQAHTFCDNEGGRRSVSENVCVPVCARVVIGCVCAKFVCVRVCVVRRSVVVSAF